MTTITEALRAARACIQQDRTSLADTGMRHDNTMEPDAAAGVAEYDAVLQQIDAALAGMTHHITDELLLKVYELLWGEHPECLIKESDLMSLLGMRSAKTTPLADWSVDVFDDDEEGRTYINIRNPDDDVAAAGVNTYVVGNRRTLASQVLHGFRQAFHSALTAAPTPPAQAAVPSLQPVCRYISEVLSGDASSGEKHIARTIMHLLPLEQAALGTNAQPAVPEDVAREPMTQRWCWWIGDAETFHIADTESEAHSEAQCRIDDDCEPGGTHEYSVARVQHPIDALGMDWLAEHAAETIEENACCWCDDNTGAEDPSITLAAEDRKLLGTMVATFLRERAAVHWWTADQKTITTHTYVAGSNDADAARKAEKGGA